MTADRERGIPPKVITWTSVPPPRGRLGPENMPTKPRALSEEAKAAESLVELQQLFFTEEMLELLVRYTNEKIAEDIQQNQYTEDRLKKAPHLKPVGMVIIPYIFMPISWEVVKYRTQGFGACLFWGGFGNF